MAAGSWHTPLESQQPWHALGEQVLPLPTHAPPTACAVQVSFDAVHCSHARPCEPQSFAAVPGRHIPAAQQPEHVAGPHAACPSEPPSSSEPHAPPVPPLRDGMHVSPRAVQSVQVWPAKPHAEALVPAEHPTDVQHPVGQVDAVHAGCASPESMATPESSPESMPESATSIVVASEGPSVNASLSEDSSPPSPPGPSLPGAVVPPHELAESTSNIAATGSTRLAMPVQCPLSLESVKATVP